MSGLIHSNRVKILCVGFIVIVYVTGIPLYYNSVRFCHENVMRISEECNSCHRQMLNLKYTIPYNGIQ